MAWFQIFLPINEEVVGLCKCHKEEAMHNFSAQKLHVIIIINHNLNVLAGQLQQVLGGT